MKIISNPIFFAVNTVKQQVNSFGNSINLPNLSIFIANPYDQFTLHNIPKFKLNFKHFDQFTLHSLN